MRSAFEFDRLLGMLPDVSRYGVRFARDGVGILGDGVGVVAISWAAGDAVRLDRRRPQAAAASAATVAIQSLRSNPSGMSGATRAAPAQRRRGPGQRGCGGQHRQPEELRGLLHLRFAAATRKPRRLGEACQLGRPETDQPVTRWVARQPSAAIFPTVVAVPRPPIESPARRTARPLASSREPGLQRVDEQQFGRRTPHET